MTEPTFNVPKKDVDHALRIEESVTDAERHRYFEYMNFRPMSVRVAAHTGPSGDYDGVGIDIRDGCILSNLFNNNRKNPIIHPDRLPLTPTPEPKMKQIIRPAQHESESAIDYFRRIAVNLEFEHEDILQRLPTIGALIDYFELWHTYDTEYLAGIVESIDEGASVAPLRKFEKKHGVKLL